MGLRRRARERAVQALYQLDGISFSPEALGPRAAAVPPLEAPRAAAEPPPVERELLWKLSGSTGGAALVRRRKPAPGTKSPAAMPEPPPTPPATLDDALDAFWASFDPPESEVRLLADPLIRGALVHRAELDERVEQTSLHWRIERMARVDRNILRLGVYELLHRPDVPTKVCLNEAIEIARKFGSEESGAFINGVLDKIAKTVRAPEGEPAAPPEGDE